MISSSNYLLWHDLVTFTIWFVCAVSVIQIQHTFDGRFLCKWGKSVMYLRNITDKTSVLFGLLPTLRRKKWINWSNFNVALCKNQNPEEKKPFHAIFNLISNAEIAIGNNGFVWICKILHAKCFHMNIFRFNFLSRGICITRWFVYMWIKDLWHIHFDLFTASLVLSYTFLSPMTSASHDFLLRYPNSPSKAAFSHSNVSHTCDRVMSSISLTRNSSIGASSASKSKSSFRSNSPSILFKVSAHYVKIKVWQHDQLIKTYLICHLIAWSVEW